MTAAELGPPVLDESWKRFIEQNAALSGMEIRRRHTDRFARHGEELLRWNRKINLTAIIDPQEMAVKHFLDSAVPAGFVPENADLLDIGSGGGFPGLVLKTLVPSLKVTLIDASLKKVNFLKHVSRTLGLTGVRVFHLRVEELIRRGECFHVVISRALTAPERFLRMAQPLTSPAGLIIAMTGPGAGDERTVRSSPGSAGDFEFTEHVYSLPGLSHERRLCMFRKA